MSQIQISTDGTEARLTLQPGVRVGQVIDLGLFGPFDPKQQPNGRCPYGEPTEMVEWKWERLCVYERDGKRVAVVEFQERSSWGDKRIVRRTLRALPRDPLYSRALPPDVRSVLEKEKKLSNIVLLRNDSADISIVLNVEGGRIRGVTAAP